MSLSPLHQLSQRAALRHGVVTVAEASQFGVTRSALRSAIRRGEWGNPHRGVLVAAAAPATWLQRCAIAVAFSNGMASHRAGGRVHRLDGFDDAPVELTVASGGHWPSTEWLCHRSSRFERRDITDVDGVRVTSIARTLVDLGAVVDDDLVEQALDDALRRRVSMKWILATLERLDRPGPSGVSALRRVLDRPDRHGPIPESMFERTVERICTEAALPPPVRQHEVRDGQGCVIARLDAAWPEVRLGLEAHSDRWHSGTRNGRADQRRDNQLAAVGWELIYAGWHDVQNPDEFVAIVRDAYAWRLRGRPEFGA